MGNLQKRNFRYSLKRFLTLLVSLYHALSALFKNNLNICMKNEPVMAGAEQRYMSGCWALGTGQPKLDTYRCILFYFSTRFCIIYVCLYV